jgi:hypothetical protein
MSLVTEGAGGIPLWLVANKYIKTKEIHGGYLVVYILLGTHAWTMCTDHVCSCLSMNKIIGQRGMTKVCEKEA